MSSAYKTRYEVQKILADCIKAGLTAYVGQNHGFSVMEFAQASFQSADKIILINPIRNKNLSWNMTSFPVVSGSLKRRDSVIEEQRWQVHAILKKGQSPAITDMQADDVAGILVNWFNGAGCDYLRSNGCSCTRVESESIIVYNDDSELYQKRAVFTVKLQVPKEMQMAETEMDALLPKVKPV